MYLSNKRIQNKAMFQLEINVISNRPVMLKKC